MWGVVGALSVTVSTAVAVADGALSPLHVVVAIAVLVGLGSVIEVLIPLASRTLAVDLTETGVVLGLALVSPPAIVLPVAAGTLLADLLRRRPITQTLFNASVNGASAAVVALALGPLGDGPPVATEPVGLATLLAGLLLYGTVNTAANGFLLSLLDDTAYELTIRSIVAGSSVSLALSGSLGVLAAVLVTEAPVVLVALVLPAWIAYRALNERVARIREEVAERDRLERTVEGVNDGIALLDADGRLELANPVFCDRLHVTTEEAPGRALHDLLEGEAAERYQATLARLTPDRAQGADDVHLDERVYSLQLVGLFDRLGAGTGTVALLLDVTEDREAEWMRREFVARVSHELRTPLTSIGGFVETLRDRGDALSPVERDRYLEIVQRQSSRLERLVAALLWRSRIERERVTPDPGPINVRDLVDEVLDTLEDVLPGTVAVDGEDLVVLADPDHLQQIMLNLLVNAATYGQAPIGIRISTQDSIVMTEVSDAGPGVSEVFVRDLFKPFAQASMGDRRTATGLGLGLSIVRSLAEENGGEVRYLRVDGRTRFQVRLPAPSAGDAAAGSASA